MEEFNSRIYQNKSNLQLSLIIVKKNISPELLNILCDPNVIGLKLKIVEKLTKMPAPNFKLSRAARKKNYGYLKKYLDKKKKESTPIDAKVASYGASTFSKEKGVKK